MTVTPGQAWSGSIELSNPSGSAAVARLVLLFVGGTQVNGPNVTIPAGGTAVLGNVNAVAGAGSTSVRFIVDVVTPNGGVLVAHDGPTLEKSAQIEGRFAPGLPSPDPDMTARWLGTPNASESVLEGQHPVGFTDQDVVSIIHEVGDGTRELRQIPTSTTSSNSFTSYNIPSIPAGLRVAGAVLGTSRIPVTLSGTLDRPNSVGVYSPSNFTTMPRDAGTYNQRFVYPTITSTYGSALRHGGRSGSGDVYWSEIGLFEGDYDGPWFDGNSGTIVINGRSYRTQWDGTPGNSTSSAWTMTPEFDRLKEGTWIGGQGHSGCRFIGKPTYVNNTGVDGGQVSFAASFREVGLWVNG